MCMYRVMLCVVLCGVGLCLFCGWGWVGGVGGGGGGGVVGGMSGGWYGGGYVCVFHSVIL